MGPEAVHTKQKTRDQSWSFRFTMYKKAVEYHKLRENSQKSLCIGSKTWGQLGYAYVRV